MIPRRIVSMSFHPGIPWRVALQQSSPSAFPDTQIMLDDEPKVLQDYSERGSAFILRVSP